MRLWHYKLLPYLPDAQFKGQLRELVAILHDWRDKALEKVTVLGGNICYNAFYFVTMIDEIELGGNVGSVIGEKAFYACYDLKRLTVNGYVTEIGADAFIYSGIETVVLSSKAYDLWEQIVFANDNANPTKLGATIFTKITPGGNIFA